MNTLKILRYPLLTTKAIPITFPLSPPDEETIDLMVGTIFEGFT